MAIFEYLILALSVLTGTLTSIWPPLPDRSFAASQSQLFPVFSPDVDEFAGLTMVNTAMVTNDVSITWTDSDGYTVETVSLSLIPGSQRVALVKELLGIPHDPDSGWIRIDSSMPGLLSWMTSGRDEVLDGAEPASLVSTTLVLSHVAIDTGFMELEYTDTLALLVNPGMTSASANVELVGMDGYSAGTLPITIPAGASRTLRVSDSFRDALPPNGVGGRTFRGYMRVSSDSALAGWLRIDTPLSRRILLGRGVDEITPARLVLAGHFASGGAILYRSELNFINSGDTAVTLELEARDDRGRGVGRAVWRTLNPGQGIREDILSLFGVIMPAVFPPPMLTGYIRIRAAEGGVFRGIGDINISCPGNAAAMLYPLMTAAAFPSDATIPFVINDSDYFTGYAVANPNELLTVQTDLTIDVLDQDGRPLGQSRQVSLSPAARFVSLVEQKTRSGYLRVRASGPVAIAGCLGTHNTSALLSVPALP